VGLDTDPALHRESFFEQAGIYGKRSNGSGTKIGGNNGSAVT
jgi:hypothetical protein